MDARVLADVTHIATASAPTLVVFPSPAGSAGSASSLPPRATKGTPIVPPLPSLGSVTVGVGGVVGVAGGALSLFSSNGDDASYHNATLLRRVFLERPGR